VTSEIDLTRLDPLLKSVGWTREEAERDLRVDFSHPVSSDIKNHLWQAIQIANRFKMFYPQTKVTGMRYVNPGTAAGIVTTGSGTDG
jgi:hypothetical protein